MLSDVLRGANRAPADELSSVVLDGLKGLGARGALLYLADYERSELQPAPGGITSRGEPAAQPVHGSSAGDVFRTGRASDLPTEDGHLVWAPICERSDVIGVLELEFETLEDNQRELCSELGMMLGHLLTTARKYTDSYELVRRRRDMNLAAEMHWDVLPAMCYAAAGVSVACGIEPAYEVGGDAFDYSVNHHVLDVAMFDAMGHGLEAALLSSQAVSAYRYARRRKQSLTRIAQTIEDTLLHQFGGEKLVTALFCELHSETGMFRWVNTGHLPPLLLRSSRVEQELLSQPDCPLGLGCLDRAEMFEVALEPGDAVLLYSDGVVEARSPQGDFFELERLCNLVEREPAGAPVAMMVQRVIEEVKAHTSAPLKDDATVVVMEYDPGR